MCYIKMYITWWGIGQAWRVIFLGYAFVVCECFVMPWVQLNWTHISARKFVFVQSPPTKRVIPLLQQIFVYLLMKICCFCSCGSVVVQLWDDHWITESYLGPAVSVPTSLEQVMEPSMKNIQIHLNNKYIRYNILCNNSCIREMAGCFNTRKK